MTINNKSISPDYVRHIRRNDLDEAKEVAEDNGADDVFVQFDDGVRVATGTGFPADIQVGDEVEFKGQSGEVIAYDNQVNGFFEGASDMRRVGQSIRSKVGAVSDFVYESLKFLMDKFFGVMDGVVGGIYGLVRPVDEDSFKQLEARNPFIDE
jgi:hypothetical protein